MSVRISAVWFLVGNKKSTGNKLYIQCCGSGMFYPGSGSDHFLEPDPDPNIFSSLIPDPTWKVECKLTVPVLFSCFLWFQEQSLSLSQSQKDSGSEKNSSRIRMPDPGGKKAPDPGSWTAPLVHYIVINIELCLISRSFFLAPLF
jgi:hypothetical protein